MIVRELLSGVVLLGALSTLIQDVPADIWLQVFEERVPERFIEVNRRAFEAGKRAGLPCT